MTASKQITAERWLLKKGKQLTKILTTKHLINESASSKGKKFLQKNPKFIEQSLSLHSSLLSKKHNYNGTLLLL